ncbi:MAG: hypothetical protein IH945_01080 [Armatimonadetes bacterium]|nr:hypothetical protein [Armatimonadota bacterium]
MIDADPTPIKEALKARKVVPYPNVTDPTILSLKPSSIAAIDLLLFIHKGDHPEDCGSVLQAIDEDVAVCNDR